MTDKHEQFSQELEELLEKYDASLVAQSYPKIGPGRLTAVFYVEAENWLGEPVRLMESQLALGSQVGEGKKENKGNK